MEIVITIGSIFALTGAAWLAGKVLPIKVCPICAGVSLTWFWMLAGMRLGILPLSRFELPAAILMGGSAVGIAYQLEKRLPAGRSPLLWKSLFIPSGFAAAYGLVVQSWTIALAGAAFAATVASIFFARRMKGRPTNTTVAELEEKMKGCC